MRITFKRALSQLPRSCVLLLAIFMISCRGGRDDSVIPPVTFPLSNEVIGYGVVTDSFTHIQVDPQEDGESLGYLRRGSIVRVVRRQAVKTETGYQSWVLTDDPQDGWIKESVMSIYDTESRAKTASQALGS